MVWLSAPVLCIQCNNTVFFLTHWVASRDILSSCVPMDYLWLWISCSDQFIIVGSHVSRRYLWVLFSCQMLFPQTLLWSWSQTSPFWINLVGLNSLLAGIHSYTLGYFQWRMMSQSTTVPNALFEFFYFWFVGCFHFPNLCQGTELSESHSVRWRFGSAVSVLLWWQHMPSQITSLAQLP